jgi:hypothetical protein
MVGHDSHARRCSHRMVTDDEQLCCDGARGRSGGPCGCTAGDHLRGAPSRAESSTAMIYAVIATILVMDTFQTLLHK